MAQNYAGQAFIVTGGASGIGLATVKKLLHLGATVHVVDVSNQRLELSTSPGTLWVYPGVDVSSRDAMSKTFKEIGERSPVLRGMVNCAGIVKPTPTLGGSESDQAFKAVLDVNLMGTWNSSTEFISLVAPSSTTDTQNIWRSVVNVGSLAAFKGIQHMSAYVASKHAILGLTRTWAQEWAPHRVRVNAVAPGLIKTPLVGNGAHLPEGGPLASVSGRLGEPEEVADSIMFLLSDAASYVNGQMVEVSGGLP